MIRKGLGSHQRRAKFFQCFKEFLGLADTRKGDVGPARPIHARLQWAQFRLKSRQVFGDGRVKSGLCIGRAYCDQRIRAGQPCGHRFAQGACGDAAPVSELANGIDHYDFQILMQGRVLKAVIQNDDSGSCILRRPTASGAVL